jgi:acyl transferase domain-containing protein
MYREASHSEPGPGAPSESNVTEIAIVGMSGRFPGAGGVAEFWSNLLAGRETLSSFDAEQLAAAGVAPEVARDRRYVPTRGVLERIEEFDPYFFGINPREAEVMDPQHRVFLECAWEALEDAGYRPDAHRGLVGVYASAYLSTYLVRHLLPQRAALADLGEALVHQVNVVDGLATRASYKLDLRGPSVAVQAACSSSLAAVHLACQGLLSGECDAAVAGGACVRTPQEAGYLYQERGIESPDGHCRAFDAGARGTVFSNGVGVVVLKRLQDAQRDGDHVYAVIKGSALNNDGAAKVGFTAPSVEGQAEAIAQALSMAGVGAESIGYVEAHGTGTALGDPIEVEALARVFGEAGGRAAPCALGSVKTNVGHLDVAAGVAGLIKAALAVRDGVIPPTLHFETPNPELRLHERPFFVSASRCDWPALPGPRRAGVSAFGVGGTNVHVVLEQAPPAPARAAGASGGELLVISAATEASLAAASGRLAGHLESADAPLADVAYTLAVGRKPLPFRRALACASAAEAAAAFGAGGGALREGRVERPARVAFLLPGQGSQHPGMGAGLYAEYATFRREVDRCVRLLAPPLGDAVRALFTPDGAGVSADALAQTELTQPAIFVLEYALARTLTHWGVRPAALLGHSLGEYVAACLAGVLSLADALRLVVARGRLMQGMAPGGMLAVALSAEGVRPLLGAGLSLAAVNAADQCVVAGPEAALAAFAQGLAGRGVSARRLSTSHAYHSASVEPAIEAFRRELAGVELNAPETPFVSNVTGDWASAEAVCDPEYWVRHLRQTVLFAEGLEKLAGLDDVVLLEVGPGGALSALARQAGRVAAERVVTSLPRPGGALSAPAHLRDALGRLFVAGAEIDFERVYAGQARRRVSLPTYAFDRRRCWVDPPGVAAAGGAAGALERTPDVGDWFYAKSWRRAPPGPARAGLPAGQRSSWLVFADDVGLGAELARQLERGGQIVTVVRPGGRYERLDRGLFAVAPGSRADYEALLRDLRGLAVTPSRVAHLWGVTRGEPREGEALERGFYSLLRLAQAMAAMNVTGPLSLVVASNGVHDVLGDEALDPDKAAALGPCKALPQEFAHARCRHVDVRLDGSARGLAECAAMLAREADEPGPARVAYRGAYRWIEAYDPLRLDPVASPPPGPIARFGRGDACLVTGGLGGVGLALARALAERAQAKLVLLGRTPLPPRDSWERLLSSRPSDDPTSRRLERVRGLEALGAEVMAVTADVADEGQVRRALASARERFGPLRGVVHAAGVPGGGAMAGRRDEDVAAVLRPKVEGTRVLERALNWDELYFVAFCSSTASVLGGYGQADYGAANAFLDATAQRLARAGAPAMSLNWDTWQGVGMAAEARLPEGLREIAEENLRQGILPDEGGDAFWRALSVGAPQLVVSARPLARAIELASGRALVERAARSSARAPHARPELSGEYVAPRTELEEKTAAVWRQLLGLDRVGVHDDFFELGGHSLLGTQVVARLRELFAIDLPVAALFEGPTVAQLAEAIEDVILSEEEERSDGA